MHKENVMRSALAILAAAVLSLASGCQLLQMQVSAPLDVWPPVPVDRAFARKWNDPVSFGAWHTTSVNEGDTEWSPGRSAGAHQRTVQNVSLERVYGFVLATAAADIHAGCFARLDATTYGNTIFDVGALHGDPALQCTYDGATPGSMELFEVLKVGSDAQAGYLDFDARRWQIQSVDRVVGARSPDMIVGYEIHDEEAVIGAVETINRGRVWIAPSLSPIDRDRVAAVVATLLLYRPLHDELEAEQSR
jgi:hypothetical protein